jgi:hypothetical protein
MVTRGGSIIACASNNLPTSSQSTDCPLAAAYRSFGDNEHQGPLRVDLDRTTSAIGSNCCTRT